MKVYNMKREGIIEGSAFQISIKKKKRNERSKGKFYYYY